MSRRSKINKLIIISLFLVSASFADDMLNKMINDEYENISSRTAIDYDTKVVQAWRDSSWVNKSKKVKEQLLSEEVVASLVQRSPLVDAQTNTECVFLSPSAASNSINSRGKPLTPTKNSNTGLTVPSNENNSVSALVRRSQTFTPSAPINKNDYVCKVSYLYQLFSQVYLF